MTMAPGSPTSPAETSRLLGAVESDGIDLIIGGENDDSVSPPYAELAQSLLAEQEDVPETTLAPPSPPRGFGRLRSRCCCGSAAARLPADVDAARLAVRKMAKVRFDLPQNSSPGLCLPVLRARLSLISHTAARRCPQIKLADEPGARRALHVASLQAVFLELTGAQPPPAASSNRPSPDDAGSGDGFVGDHWESIGFQGADPSRDLRAAGMLAVLQLRYLTTHHSAFAKGMLALSNDAEQYFPFATVSVNVTAIVLAVLRSRACREQSEQ